MSASEAERSVIAAARELVAAYNGSGSHYQQIRAVEVALHRIDAANAEERGAGKTKGRVCGRCGWLVSPDIIHACPSPPAGVSEERVREIVKDELTPYYSSEVTKAQAEIMVKIARSVLIRLQHKPDEILVNLAQGGPKVGLLFALREIGSRLIALEAASKSREPENLIQSWNREDAEIRAAVRKEAIEECINVTVYPGDAEALPITGPPFKVWSAAASKGIVAYREALAGLLQVGGS